MVSMAAAASCSAGPTQPPPLQRASQADLELGTEPVHVYVVLAGPPAVEVLPRGVPVSSPQAVARGRARLTELAAQHSRVRPLLEQHGARVVSDLRRLANAIQVIAPADALEALRRVPEVVRLDPVMRYAPSLKSAVPVIGAPTVWSNATPYWGQGVRIGIIDSGIDYFHADLGGSGDIDEYKNDDPTIIEPGSFPTARVVGGYDFAGDAYNANNPDTGVPEPDPDPRDCRIEKNDKYAGGGHGSHVTGIAAGNGVLNDGTPFAGPYAQSLDPSEFRIAPGVAPQAQLYALKVFGCSGSTNLLGAALERAADPNEDGNFGDRLDVVNASLGSAYGIQSPINSQLVANLSAVGSLFVVAAGNDSNTFFITGSPGNYPQTLSVAASADNEFIALSIDKPALIAGDIPASEGFFTTPLATSGPISGQLVHVDPPLACSPITNTAQVAGNIALIDRGDCLFVAKLEIAETAGAAAVVLIDDEFNSAPWVMGGGELGQVSIPGVMIRRIHGDSIKTQLASGVSVTLDASKAYDGFGAELFASFSSRGPSAVETLLKPEVSAPGYSIDSVQVGSGIEPRRTQGTSMACPMVAGAAALLRQAHPSLGAEIIKAQLMNSAVTVSDIDGNPFQISRQGAGRINVAAAVELQASAAVDSDDGVVAVSFGSLISDVAASVERTITVRNHGDAALSYTATAAERYPLPGVSVSVSPSELELAGGESGQLTVSLSLDPKALGKPPIDLLTASTQYSLPRHYLNEAAGLILLTEQTQPGQSLRLPFYGVVRAAAQRSALPAMGCVEEPAAGASIAIPIGGDSAHPSPVVSAFELGLIDDVDPMSASSDRVASTDLRAIGIASDYAVVDKFEDVSLFFAVSVTGQWVTPTQGQLSAVSVLVDSNQDGDANYLIRAEPYSREGPYADVLAATVYDLETGASTGAKRFINMVSATEQDTQPYHNSVLVLPAFAADLGLSEEDLALDYAALSQLSTGTQETTEFASYDLAARLIDTASSAPIAGRPIYGAGLPVMVDIDKSYEVSDELPKVLLLHHNNIVGQRWEVVDLSQLQTEKLSVEHSVADGVVAIAGDLVAHTITVRNDGSQPVAQVQLSAEASGAELVFVTPWQGSCIISSEQVLSCDLGNLAAGQSATIGVQLQTSDAGEASLELELSSASGCQTTSTAAFDIATPPSPTAPLSVNAGCGCRTPKTHASPRNALWLLLAGLWACRRRSRS